MCASSPFYWLPEDVMNVVYIFFLCIVLAVVVKMQSLEVLVSFGAHLGCTILDKTLKPLQTPHHYIAVCHDCLRQLCCLPLQAML